MKEDVSFRLSATPDSTHHALGIYIYIYIMVRNDCDAIGGGTGKLLGS